MRFPLLLLLLLEEKELVALLRPLEEEGSELRAILGGIVVGCDNSVEDRKFLMLEMCLNFLAL